MRTGALQLCSDHSCCVNTTHHTSVLRSRDSCGDGSVVQELTGACGAFVHIYPCVVPIFVTPSDLSKVHSSAECDNIEVLATLQVQVLAHSCDEYV